MQSMLDAIDQAITAKYEEIRKSGKVASGIRILDRKLRFNYPELAAHIKRRMTELAERDGDLGAEQRYLCDGGVPNCGKTACYLTGGPCMYTTDISHARNFVKEDGVYIEICSPSAPSGTVINIEERNRNQISRLTGYAQAIAERLKGPKNEQRAETNIISLAVPCIADQKDSEEEEDDA